MYQRSIEQPAEFWADMAQDLFWAKQVRRVSVSAGRPLFMEQVGLVSRHNTRPTCQWMPWLDCATSKACACLPACSQPLRKSEHPQPVTPDLPNRRCCAACRKSVTRLHHTATPTLCIPTHSWPLISPGLQVSRSHASS